VEINRFSGYALRGELDLHRLAGMLDINRRYRWEEAMVLAPHTLLPFCEGAAEEPRVHLYSFGAAVFVNCLTDAVADFCRRMSAHGESFRDLPTGEFHENTHCR
jgi:hypothetical protein